MINIANEQLFGKVIADALSVVGNNPDLDEGGRKRSVNAIAKAVVKIEQSGTLPAVARQIPVFVGGFQGFCVYTDDRIVRRMNVPDVELPPPDNEVEAEKWAAGYEQFLAEQKFKRILFVETNALRKSIEISLYVVSYRN